MQLSFLPPEYNSTPLSVYGDIILPSLECYQSVEQTGIREGTTLHQHLINGVIFIGSVIATLPDSSGMYLSDQDIALSLAGFTLHDANKMIGHGSLKKIAFSTDFDDLYEKHHIREFLSSFGDADFVTRAREQLRHPVVSTSGVHSGLFSMLGLRQEDQQYLRRIALVLTIADTHDLSPEFTEVRQKDKVLRDINALTGCNWKLCSHRLSEHVGPMSALLHRAAEAIVHEAGGFTLWIYGEGSWYLVPENFTLWPNVMVGAYKKQRATVMSGGIDTFVKMSKDGLKSDIEVLARFEDEELLLQLQDFFSQRSPASVWKNLSTKRIPNYNAPFPSGVCWPDGEHAVRTGQVWLGAENLLKEVDAFKGKPAAWLVDRLEIAQELREQLRLILTLKLDPIQEQPYVLMASVENAIELAHTALALAIAEARRLTGRAVGEQQLCPEVVSWVEQAVTWGDTSGSWPAKRGLSPRAAWKNYQTGVRSSLGAAIGPVDNLLSKEVLPGIKVTQFTNSQRGGLSGPARKRDELQAEYLQIQVRASPYKSGDAPLFVHLFPAGVAAGFWEAAHANIQQVKDQDQDTQQALELVADIREGQIGWTWKKRFYGLAFPDLRTFWCNGLTVPIIPAPDRTFTDACLDAIEKAVVLLKGFPGRLVVSPLPVVTAPSERLTIEGLPANLRHLLQVGTESPWSVLYQRMMSLRVLGHALRPDANDDVRAVLARNAGNLLILFHAADRLVQRKKPNFLSSFIAPLVPHLHNLCTEYPLTPRSTLVRELAEIAVHGSLRSQGYERNDYLRAINETFKSLRRAGSDAELGFAQAEDRIFRALEVDRARKGLSVGQTTRENIRQYITTFRKLLLEGYGNNLARLRADERILRSAYLTYVLAGVDAQRQARQEATTNDTLETSS